MKFRVHNKSYKSGNGIYIAYKDSDPRGGRSITREYEVRSANLGIDAKFSFEVKLGGNAEMGIGDYYAKEQGHLQVEKIDEEGKFWHLGYKYYGLQPKGQMTIKDKTHTIDNTSLMMIDHGAGVFQYKTHWVWISANFVNKEGKRMAFNIGGGIAKTDTSKASEDYFIVEGKTTLLEAVEVVYDMNTLGTGNWHFETKNKDFFRNGGRTVMMDFVPSKTFYENQNFLVIKSKVVQIFGYFKGTIVGDDGKEYEIDNVQGLSEFHYAQW